MATVTKMAARIMMSTWSEFAFPRERPALTVLGIGKWDLPGDDGWGLLVRDLRTGDERVIFDEDEWHRIIKSGLPPLGAPWGETRLERPELHPPIESFLEHKSPPIE